MARPVPLVGMVHHQRRVGALAVEAVEELASFRCVVRLPGREREGQGRPGIRAGIGGNHIKFGGPAAVRSADRRGGRFFRRLRSVGMDLDDGARRGRCAMAC